MSEETKQIIVPCITTLLAAIISPILVYPISKLNYLSNKKISILEEQYLNIFAPIHKLISFDKHSQDKFLYIEIKEIISKNYSILPESIRASFCEIDENNLDEKFKEFKTKINICFYYISHKLNYSKNKLSYSERKKAKKELNSQSQDLIISKYSIIISIILVSIFSLIISYIITNSTDIVFTPIVLACVIIISEVLLAVLTIISALIFNKLHKK